MKEKILVFIALMLTFGIGFMVGQILFIKSGPTQITKKIVDRSLDKYTIENLSNVDFSKFDFQFSIQKELKDFPNFSSNEFIADMNLDTSGKNTNKISGLINIPKDNASHPLLIMIRGYVDKKDYFVGNGTINASYFFANNGFVTVSPDFLGYGDSDSEPSNVFEARFQTYSVILNLLSHVSKIPSWDGKNVFIWAHSNGGQIALTSLEITGITYPTVLWAPVSAPFPFSVLYYSDETGDKGKAIRKLTAAFEDVYNSDLYSLANYLNKIKAPIQLDQGTNDESVPISWSDSLQKILKGQGLQINYNVYPGADHQMTPLWNNVIQKDLEFFRTELKN